MVKALFGTAALAGLALVAIGSTPSYGETLSSGNVPPCLKSGNVPPSLKIDGFTAVNAYVMNQQRRENGKGGPQPHIGVDVSNLFFTIIGPSMSGLEYQYRVSLETIPNSSSIIDRNYVQIKSKLGTIQIGDTVGPEDSMIWDASKIFGGTGGFNGGYSSVYNMSAGVMRGNDNIGDTGNATKDVYYSPEIMGFQVGVAYTPSTSHRGNGNLDNMAGKNGGSKFPGNRGLYDVAGNQPFDLRNVAVGVTYKKEMGKWSMTLSGAGITAKSYFFNSIGGPGTTRVPFQNTKAYQLGAVFGYGDFRFGGGYLDNGKSHLPNRQNFTYGGSTGRNVNLGSMNNGNAGHAFNIGAGYTIGAYQLGSSFRRTNRNTGNLEKAHSDFYSATVDVTPLQGLKVYTEVDYIRSRTNSTAVARESQFLANTSSNSNVGVGNNAGLLGIVGTKVSF